MKPSRSRPPDRRGRQGWRHSFRQGSCARRRRRYSGPGSRRRGCPRSPQNQAGPTEQFRVGAVVKNPVGAEILGVDTTLDVADGERVAGPDGMRRLSSRTSSARRSLHQSPMRVDAAGRRDAVELGQVAAREDEVLGDSASAHHFLVGIDVGAKRRSMRRRVG